MAYDPIGSATNPYPVIDTVTSEAYSTKWLWLTSIALVGLWLYKKAR